MQNLRGLTDSEGSDNEHTKYGADKSNNYSSTQTAKVSKTSTVAPERRSQKANAESNQDLQPPQQLQSKQETEYSAFPSENMSPEARVEHVVAPVTAPSAQASPNEYQQQPCDEQNEQTDVALGLQASDPVTSSSPMNYGKNRGSPKRCVVASKSRSPAARKANKGFAATKKFERQAAAVMSSYPEYRPSAHRQYVGQVEPSDLQAQVYVKQVQGKERELRQQRVAQLGGIAADAQAVEQHRLMMQMQANIDNENLQQQQLQSQEGSGEAGLAVNNYMVVQNRQHALLPQGGPLGALRQVKDSKKSEWQLAAEVNELKQQRNKDVEHIKILKVELLKLEQVFKKYKECLSPDSVPQVQLENLPSLVAMAQQPQQIDTEILLVEIQKIKAQLQHEIMFQKFAEAPGRQPKAAQPNDASMVASLNNSGLHQSMLQQSRVEPARNGHGSASQPRAQKSMVSGQQEMNSSVVGRAQGFCGSQAQGGAQQAQDGAAKSTMRLQLGNLKRKAKELEEQVRVKDLEISKMKEKTSEKALDSLKDELKRAYEVLRHLKKKVGAHAFNEEYGVVMSEIRQALRMPLQEKKKTVKRKVKVREPEMKSASATVQPQLFAPDELPHSAEVKQEDEERLSEQIPQDEDSPLKESSVLNEAAEDADVEEDAGAGVGVDAKEALPEPKSLAEKEDSTDAGFQLAADDEAQEPNQVSSPELAVASQAVEDAAPQKVAGPVTQSESDEGYSAVPTESPQLQQQEEQMVKASKEISADGAADQLEEEEEYAEAEGDAHSDSEPEQLSPLENKHQEEIDELEAKLDDLQAELDLSDDEFERRLLKRLEQEIKANQLSLERDLRAEVATEKKRIVNVANKEKNALKSENTKLQKEISKLKMLLRGTGKF